MPLDEEGAALAPPNHAEAEDAAGRGFEDPALPDCLDAFSEAELDALAFGVIGFNADGEVEIYNVFEATAAGLSKARVLGRHLFDEVAPCMNNYLVAQRFEEEEALDEVLPYVLTLRMRPTPVRLRLLKRPGGRRCYLLVERRLVAGAR
jgi:photoactive yellow protein